MFELVADGRGHDAAIGPGEHQDGRNHRFGAHLATRTGANRAANDDLPDVAHSHRYTGTGGDHRLPDLVDRPQAGIGADEEGFARALHVVGTRRQVSGFQRNGQVVEGHAIGRHFREVWLDDVLLHVAAVRVDASDPAHTAKLRTDHPVLHGAQVGALGYRCGEAFAFRRQVIAIALPAWLAVFFDRALPVGPGEFNTEHEDLAQAGCHRRELGLHPGRKAILRLVQPLGDLLASEIDVGGVGEHRRDLREAVACQRAGHLESRNAGERRLHGKRHLPLHVTGAKSRREGVDLHLTVGDIRHRVDG